MMTPENDEEQTSVFSATVYGDKIQGKNKRKRAIGLCIRISMVISLLSMITMSAFLIVRLNQCMSANEAVITDAAVSIAASSSTPRKVASDTTQYKHKESCNGLYYQGSCYIFHSDYQLFSDAKANCTAESSTLPNKSDVLTTWLIDYVEDTWGSDGNPITKTTSDYQDSDVSQEVRKYFCVKTMN
ncbi:EEV membrane phosphoglycoprotein [Orthopoxvirus akhmetapox]|uniref:Protein OPG161 n=1 Tax=Orthopoxvirus akhmetapox TaxID=2200830 RepID=A0A346FSZ5_9POXV|nr:EEV membrane phosphoglycoprotein [Akhmeta virus]QEQ49709.1 EEV membrane phosphoglycoprotein [Akhmeta virus]QEQ49922.1 EEV membrane phosphoglycoprotein [Akhmeta virus]